MGTLGTFAVGLAMALGIALAVVPVAPGLLVIWLAAAAYGIGTGMDGPAWLAMSVITVLGVGGFAAALVLPGRGASTRGAPTSTLAAGVAGAVVGAVVLPVLGLPIGGVVGILLAEWQRQGQLDAAWQVTIGVLRGLGVAALVQLLAGCAMVATWIVWVLVRVLG